MRVGNRSDLPGARCGFGEALAADDEGAGGGVLRGFEGRAGEHAVEGVAWRELAGHRVGGGAADAIDEVDDRRAGGGGELLERVGGVAAGEVKRPLRSRGGHWGRRASDDGAAQGGDGEGSGDVG